MTDIYENRYKSDLVLSLDLELNQPSNKIIQVGACIGNLRTGELMLLFRQHVHLDEPLNPRITALTGITEDHLKNAAPLPIIYKELELFKQRFPVLPWAVTWGGGDCEHLVDQVREYSPMSRNIFGRRWIDIKTLFQARQFARGEKMQAGLAKAMTKCGLKFEGQKHQALDDAINTFRLAHHLLKEAGMK